MRWAVVIVCVLTWGLPVQANDADQKAVSDLRAALPGDFTAVGESGSLQTHDLLLGAVNHVRWRRDGALWTGWEQFTYARPKSSGVSTELVKVELNCDLYELTQLSAVSYDKDKRVLHQYTESGRGEAHALVPGSLGEAFADVACALTK